MKITKEMRIRATKNKITRIEGQINTDVTWGYPDELNRHAKELKKAKSELKQLQGK